MGKVGGAIVIKGGRGGVVIIKGGGEGAVVIKGRVSKNKRYYIISKKMTVTIRFMTV